MMGVSASGVAPGGLGHTLIRTILCVANSFRLNRYPEVRNKLSPTSTPEQFAALCAAQPKKMPARCTHHTLRRRNNCSQVAPNDPQLMGIQIETPGLNLQKFPTNRWRTKLPIFWRALLCKFCLPGRAHGKGGKIKHRARKEKGKKTQASRGTPSDFVCIVPESKGRV